ncbi:MAG TPA: hypothetical protein PLD23_02220 [Armatimonadota bacterium]|nr:hypothetical protein [Armatimonadota bacterium]HQK92289.1 hypothetical protein [Armatimonadota bacterium]
MIRETDDRHHPIAVHKTDGLSLPEFAGHPESGRYAIQCNVNPADELHRGLLEMRRDAARRYAVILAEAVYWGTGAEARRKAWDRAMRALRPWQ